MEITLQNARTETIETAVQQLSNNENLTITDVRRFLDIFTTKEISTGIIKQFKLPNGETTQYEEKKRISDVYKYRGDENEIYIRAIQNALTNKDFRKDLKGETCKLSDVLKWLKKEASFVQKEDITKFVEWVLKSIQDIQNTCKTGKVDTTNQNGMHLVLNSTTKGSGKSTFIHKLIEMAKEAGIEAKDEVKLPEGGFYNTKEEARNLLIGYAERVNQKVDEATIMHFGRREMYDYTEKGKMTVDLPSRAITIGSTNGNPYGRDDRCFRVINCISADYKLRTNFLQTLSTSVTPCNICIYKSETSKFVDFVSLFNSEGVDNNKNKNASKFVTNKFYKQIPGLSLLQDTLSSLSCSLEQLSFVSVKGLAKLYKQSTSQELTFNQQKLLAECLNKLYSEKLISVRGPIDDFKRQYDLYSIREDILSYDEDLQERTIEDEIRDAMLEWDRLISLAESLEVNDVSKTTNCSEENKTMTLGDIENDINEKLKITKSVDVMTLDEVQRHLVNYLNIIGKEAFEEVLDSLPNTYYDDEEDRHSRDLLKAIKLKF